MLHQPPQVFFCYFGLPCINGFFKSLFFPNSSSLWYLQFLDSPSSFSVTLLWRSYYWKVKGGAGICGKPFVSRNHPPFPLVAFLIFLNFWENQKLHFYILQVFSTLVSFEVEGAFESSWAPTRPCVELALLHLLLLLFIIIFITFHHLLKVFFIKTLSVSSWEGRQTRFPKKWENGIHFSNHFVMQCKPLPNYAPCLLGGWVLPPPHHPGEMGIPPEVRFFSMFGAELEKNSWIQNWPHKRGSLEPPPYGGMPNPPFATNTWFNERPCSDRNSCHQIVLWTGGHEKFRGLFHKKSLCRCTQFLPLIT